MAPPIHIHIYIHITTLDSRYFYSMQGFRILVYSYGYITCGLYVRSYAFKRLTIPAATLNGEVERHEALASAHQNAHDAHVGTLLARGLHGVHVDDRRCWRRGRRQHLDSALVPSIDPVAHLRANDQKHILDECYSVR